MSKTVTIQKTSKPIKLMIAIGFFGTAVSIVAWIAGAAWAPLATGIFAAMLVLGKIAAWWRHG